MEDLAPESTSVLALQDGREPLVKLQSAHRSVKMEGHAPHRTLVPVLQDGLELLVKLQFAHNPA